jgi:hypothetical protein
MEGGGRMSDIGHEMVVAHLSEMAAMSQREWPPIAEVEGYEIVTDSAYQGFDNAPDLGYPEPRFWCRSIIVRRLSDGAHGWGIGPQAGAYDMALRHANAGGEP